MLFKNSIAQKADQRQKYDGESTKKLSILHFQMNHYYKYKV